MANALRARRKHQLRIALDSAAGRCRPGNRILLREAWVAGRTRQGRDHHCAVRQAEFAVFADGWRQYDDGRGRQGHPPALRGHPWVSAALLPRWAHRTALIVQTVRHQHLQDMTTDDFRAEGIRPVFGGWRWCLPKPLPGWHPTAAAAFAAYWDTTHAAPGTRWADNPRILVLNVSVAKARG
ncbi:hypothetical protein ASE75_12640 [Sphingomonas sp. Leaf17]|uniref:hypothetical protein n=1 Tax=Sphingomonas sp. Leaf17 TaxID=1735683 RepID=UPI0006FCA9BC|nr:hypothetical protein [Sphingomonas sp. Leaf17]KQM63308.1 hypothetical protein ASE75_12640 [Sphingomonas sp. Leaf17]